MRTTHDGSAPTLLVNGERGSPVLHQVTDRLQENDAASSADHDRKAFHLMYADDPQAFNHAVLTFLQRHSGPSLTSS